MSAESGMSAARWHKSTKSGANGNCVEVAENVASVVLVRDTKDGGAGPVLRIAPTAWIGFLASCKAGEFER